MASKAAAKILGFTKHETIALSELNYMDNKKESLLNKYIILLRGINVGGNNLVPMKELVPVLEHNGFKNIRTILQTGNIILENESDPLDDIKNLIKEHFGFVPEALCLSHCEFSKIVSQNPYPEFEGKFVHFYFCKETPNPDLQRLAKISDESERYEIKGNMCYLHAPQGIGRSKLVAGLEKCLGVAATGRNLNTVKKIAALLMPL